MAQVTPSHIAFDPKTQLVHTTGENKIGITNNQRKVIASSTTKFYFDESTKNSADNDANAHMLHKARRNNDSTLLNTYKISLGDIESLFKYNYVNDIKFFCETSFIDSKNNDLLHLASYYGCEEVIDYLFASGNCDNIDMENNNGETAIEIAAKRGEYAIIKNLLKMSANIDNLQKSEHKINFFAWAIKNTEYDLVKAPMSLTEINYILHALQKDLSSKNLQFICDLIINSEHNLEGFFVENLELISRTISDDNNTIFPKNPCTQIEPIDNSSMLAIIRELVTNKFAIKNMIIKNIEQKNRNVILFLAKYELLNHNNTVIALITAFHCRDIQTAQLLNYNTNIMEGIFTYSEQKNDTDIIQGMFYCKKYIPQILTKDEIKLFIDIAMEEENIKLMHFFLQNDNTSAIMLRACVMSDSFSVSYILDELFIDFPKGKIINDPIAFSLAPPHILQILVDNGADINTLTPNNNTALSLACKLKQPKNIKWLIENGAVITPTTIFSAYNAGNFHILTNYLIPNFNATQYESNNDTSSQLVKQIIQERVEYQQFLKSYIDFASHNEIIKELKPLITGLKAELNIGNMKILSEITDFIILKKNITYFKITDVRIDTAKNLGYFYRQSDEMTIKFNISVKDQDNKVISKGVRYYFQQDIKGKDDNECLLKYIAEWNADSIIGAIAVQGNRNILDNRSDVYISNFNLIDGIISVMKYGKEVYIPITPEIYDYKNKIIHLDKLFPQDPQTTAELIEDRTPVSKYEEVLENEDMQFYQIDDDDELEKILLSIHKPNTSNNLSESEQLVMINGVQTPLKKLIQNGELALDLSKQLF